MEVSLKTPCSGACDLEVSEVKDIRHDNRKLQQVHSLTCRHLTCVLSLSQMIGKCAEVVTWTVGKCAEAVSWTVGKCAEAVWPLVRMPDIMRDNTT